MKLADYLYRTGITPGQLRVMLGVKSRSTVIRYITGERVPKTPILNQIEELSGGLVTRTDFLDPEPAQCARVVLDRYGNERVVYPWTTTERHPIAANDNTPSAWRSRPDWPPGRPKPPAAESPSPSPFPREPWPSRPLQRAIDELGSRVRPCRRGGFLLDGRMVDAKRIVGTANAIRVKRGSAPIPYPGLEPLE